MHTISSSFLARILPFVDKLKAFIFYKCLQQSFFIYKLISIEKVRFIYLSLTFSRLT